MVDAARGLGGFFPPVVMAPIKSLTGGYALGFVLLAAVAVVCLVVLVASDRPRAKPTPSLPRSEPGPAVGSR